MEKNVIGEKNGKYGKIVFDSKGMKFLNADKIDFNRLSCRLVKFQLDKEGYFKGIAELQYDHDQIINVRI